MRDEEIVMVRSPIVQDGKQIYKLAKASEALDTNSEYTYLLLGVHFAQTSSVAEVNGKLVGFVKAYIPPNQPDTLFVWQICMESAQRKSGIARKMIFDILRREFCRNVRYIHTTITPSNEASGGFFKSLACALDADIIAHPLFSSDYFSAPHEDEDLFIIGPFSHQANEVNR